MLGLSIPQSNERPRRTAGAFRVVRDLNILVNTAGVHLSTAWLEESLRQEAAIVNVTSGLGLVPKADVPVYCATKAGLSPFTPALRMQLAGTSVRVVELIPPVVASRMTEDRDGRKATPESVAVELVGALQEDRVDVPVGPIKAFIW